MRYELLALVALAVLVTWKGLRYWQRIYHRSPVAGWAVTAFLFWGVVLLLSPGSPRTKTAAAALMVAVVAFHPYSRTRLLEHRRLTRWRRDWRSWCARLGLREEQQTAEHLWWLPARITHRERREPDLQAVEQTPSGFALRVFFHSGWAPEDIEQRASRLAALTHARQVVVARDPADAGMAWVRIIDRDPLEHRTGDWPGPAQPCSLWNPVPIGVDEHGHPATIEIAGMQVLVGGTTGSGKSVVLSMLLAAAALDPNVRLTLFDYKRVEFAYWRPVAARVLGPEMNEAVLALRGLNQELDRRRQSLEARGLRKLEPGEPLHVIVVDELAAYTAGGGSREQRAEFTRLLRLLVQQGRALGFVVIAATQKPSGKVIDTSLRDEFGSRLALRTNVRQASDTILGDGWASGGYDSSRLPRGKGNEGHGYLLAEGAQPTRIRSYFLSDDTIRQIVATAVAMRTVPSGEHPPHFAGVAPAPNGSDGHAPPVPPDSAVVSPPQRAPAKARKHGHARKGQRSPTYQSWRAIKQRCMNPRHEAYPKYGGAGVRVCAWWHGFDAFLADMGERPDGMTADRIDPAGHYSCGHCEQCEQRGWPLNLRWATPAQQRANRRQVEG